MFNHETSAQFLSLPTVQKKKFLLHETSDQFLNIARTMVRRKKLLEHETSAQFPSASFNIVCEEGAVSLPVPFLDFQHSLNSGIHSQIGANIARCRRVACRGL